MGDPFRMLIAAMLGFSVLSCSTMPARETGFLDRSLQIGGAAYRYSVYVPRDAVSGSVRERRPVILFLHGAGERGTDGLRPTQVGLADVLRWSPERVPAIVVFPQAPPDTRWIGEPAGAALAALDRTMKEFNGDPDRVYLTGLSMGGYGVWHLALANPDRFAALVVVCGGLLPHPTTMSVRRSPLTMHVDDPYPFVAESLRHLPIWIFHGAADETVPVDEGRRMSDELRKAGAEVKYTEYPGMGHNSWERAYGEEALWTWLFAQRK